MHLNGIVASFLVVLIQVCLCKPPIVIPPQNPNDPLTLATGTSRNVLVIGGGLAGLSAALELADRGYNVTIKEKSDENVGGKLRCVPFEAFPGQTFNIEHGFHAWFFNYFQFHDVRTRLNINDNFRPWPKVHYIFKNYLPEIIYSVGPYPLNLLGIIARSPNIKWSDAIKSTLGMPDLMFYDFEHINGKYDNITFDEWAKEKKVDQRFYDIVLRPTLSVTLNEREIFSAAEMLAFMQIYFLSNSESDGREVAKINYEDAILKPWKDYLRSKNVKILLNSTVVSLKVDPKSTNVIGTNDLNYDDQTFYDYVISTADVGAVQSILNNTFDNYNKVPAITQALIGCNNNSVSQMKVAPDYRVVRVWFDKQMNSSNSTDILETPDFSPINLVAQYHLLEQEFMDWAAKTGGSVIEFHCYTWSKFFNINTTDSEVWGLISPTAKLIYPEIFDRNFKVLATHVNKYQNFASFQKGLMPMRPKTDTCSKANLNNFYLAGDWIQTDYPSALMERAVSTGREAANQVLLKDNVRQASLKVVNLKGPGL